MFTTVFELKLFFLQMLLMNEWVSRPSSGRSLLLVRKFIDQVPVLFTFQGKFPSVLSYLSSCFTASVEHWKGDKIRHLFGSSFLLKRVFFVATNKDGRLSASLSGCACGAKPMRACGVKLAPPLVFTLPEELNLSVWHFPDLHNGADYNCQPHRIVVWIN